MEKKSVNFTLRMSPEQRFQLEFIAHKEGRTTTSLINYWLKQDIENWNQTKKNVKK